MRSTGWSAFSIPTAICRGSSRPATPHTCHHLQPVLQSSQKDLRMSHTLTQLERHLLEHLQSLEEITAARQQTLARDLSILQAQLDALQTSIAHLTDWLGTPPPEAAPT